MAVMEDRPQAFTLSAFITLSFFFNFITDFLLVLYEKQFC